MSGSKTTGSSPSREPAQTPDDAAVLRAVLTRVAGCGDTSAGIIPKNTSVIAWDLPGFESHCRITTSFGDIPIQALHLHDRVRTRAGDFLPVRWIDRFHVDADFMSRHPEAQPVSISTRALGPQQPQRPMLVSPGQPIPDVTDDDPGASAAAADLVGQPGILRARRLEITYHVFHCGMPAILCLDGAWFPVTP